MEMQRNAVMGSATEQEVRGGKQQAREHIGKKYKIGTRSQTEQAGERDLQK